MTKVTIISGFLGAGKTTFIKKLIEEIYKGQKVVLIENEFGEIGIDGGFLKDAGVQINEMNSGCICCSLVGDFGKALKQVSHDYAPDMIIIEPSGVGKLSDVIAAVENVKEEADLELENFITVADATKCKLYMKNFGEFYNNQLESATTVVLSRTQNVDEAKLETAVNLIKEHNDKASIITTPWDELTGEQIISALKHTSLVDDMLKDMDICPECGHHHEHNEECCHHDHDEHEHHHHDHDEECCHHDHDEHEHHHHEHDERRHLQSGERRLCGRGASGHGRLPRPAAQRGGRLLPQVHREARRAAAQDHDPAGLHRPVHGSRRRLLRQEGSGDHAPRHARAGACHPPARGG